ncbi:hypothetical protein SNK03_000889 [Fusarium graminearum]|uniref:Chromosome 1, complete genome n=1 Tax=Gibberella zeae (strain ATCC MYA-4620 / CBS 123657 / FGSC 9075 / NRRL 31084 / PH-1) TaxID=229533 RepID=I1RB63_GIBZE|nr:hypothetical protein FGSG_00770 [Fusarium graminearum PH-1]ESU05996.1 hypothetical protein FGSG_00770 [Fusarium graminearum PH-1]CEF72770.1 unnamed protein product [Fusarium graminearum]CZS76037.1 unnamed protein product [Fusarium graminearum]|eukprot:XP_011316481.1 hypothetical protein FGSG_00770 [Fusarium graminearum PH-1]
MPMPMLMLMLRLWLSMEFGKNVNGESQASVSPSWAATLRVPAMSAGACIVVVTLLAFLSAITRLMVSRTMAVGVPGAVSTSRLWFRCAKAVAHTCESKDKYEDTIAGPFS